MPRKLRQRSLKLLRIGQDPPFWLEGTVDEPAVSREEFNARLQSEPILNMFARFRKHGGDAERLRLALFGLNPVYVTLRRLISQRTDTTISTSPVLPIAEISGENGNYSKAMVPGAGVEPA
jgi:hypothetical protein